MAKSQLPLAPTPDDLDRHLDDLKLAFIAEHYGELAQQAAHKQCSHIEYLGHRPCFPARTIRRRRSPSAARSRHPKPHSPGSLSGDQNPGSVSLGLAHAD
jgi:hypothetical protein